MQMEDRVEHLQRDVVSIRRLTQQFSDCLDSVEVQEQEEFCVPLPRFVGNCPLGLTASASPFSSRDVLALSPPPLTPHT